MFGRNHKGRVVGEAHLTQDDTFSETRETARQNAFGFVEAVVPKKNVVVGRQVLVGKFEHNKGKQVGGEEQYQDGTRVAYRLDMDNAGNSIDVTVLGPGGNRVATSHHRWRI